MKKELVLLINFLVCFLGHQQAYGQVYDFALLTKDTTFFIKNKKYISISFLNKGNDTLFLEKPLIQPIFDQKIEKEVYHLTFKNNIGFFYIGYLIGYSDGRKEKWFPKLYFTSIPPASSKEILFLKTEKNMNIVFRFSLKKETFLDHNLYGEQIIERVIMINE